MEAPVQRPLNRQLLAEVGLHRGSRTSATDACHHRKCPLLAESLSLCPPQPRHPVSSDPEGYLAATPTRSAPTPPHLSLSFQELRAGWGYLPGPSTVSPKLYKLVASLRVCWEGTVGDRLSRALNASVLLHELCCQGPGVSVQGHNGFYGSLGQLWYGELVVTS